MHEVGSLWALSRRGRRAISLPALDVPETPLPQDLLRRDPADSLSFPEVSELDLLRYFTKLSTLNFSIDTHFYPLGSCTMKYNPRLNEVVARLSGFTGSHPLAGECLSQGNLKLLFDLQQALGTISGLPHVSLQPAAGAQGELAGVLMIKAYHQGRGDRARRRFLIPDSAHGTNPATVAMAGLEAVEISSDARGNIDLNALKAQCDERLAGIMVTNPNTLGLFEERIEEVTEAIHEGGGLVYGDGANLNAIMGIVRPGDLGFDVMHFNLHKTFSTPHGGGGPGAGPVASGETLADFLPGPRVVKRQEKYSLATPKQSIGRLRAFHGNYGVLVRAYTYLSHLGAQGLRRVSEVAVLNANYLQHLIKNIFPLPYRERCMHEFVVSGSIVPKVHTIDIAKRLIDYGFHPPTIYFPLIIPEALMIEPTETETKKTLEAFAEALHAIVDEAKRDPDFVCRAPHTRCSGRFDEVTAAKKPILKREKEKEEGVSS